MSRLSNSLNVVQLYNSTTTTTTSCIYPTSSKWDIRVSILTTCWGRMGRNIYMGITDITTESHTRSLEKRKKKFSPNGKKKENCVRAPSANSPGPHSNLHARFYSRDFSLLYTHHRSIGNVVLVYMTMFIQFSTG